MRILLVTNTPAGFSGYSNQAALVLPRWQALGHDVACLAYWGAEGALTTWSPDQHAQLYEVPAPEWKLTGGEGRPIPIYPRGKRGFGEDVISVSADHFRADLIMTLTDAWVYAADPSIFGDHRVAMWAPVDHDPIPPQVVQALRSCERPIAYSRYGETQMRHAGLDPWYIPHAIDTALFAPGDRVEARAKLQLPQDKFLVGIVGVNRGYEDNRKLWDKNLRAFAEFHARHPDTALYAHTNAGTIDPEGINLPSFAEHLGIVDSVHYPNQYRNNVIGLPDSYMPNAYRAMDVLLCVSRGEGFGLPTLEAQACGTRVIAGDWAAQPEISFDGWLIPKELADPGWSRQQANVYIPHHAALVAALESAYQAGRLEPSTLARERALEYDIDTVTRRYWQPALASLADVSRQPPRWTALVRASDGEKVTA